MEKQKSKKMLETSSEGWKRTASIFAGVATISAILITLTGWDAGIVTAVVAAIGAAVLAFGFMGDQILYRVDERVNTIATEMKKQTTELIRHNHEQDMSLKRVELLNLIHHQPHNRVEIERVARHYFVTLGGDWYATKIYSQWAEEHGGDISFVIAE